jgi:hypothetical protein
MLVVVGLLAIADLFVLYARPFGERLDFIVSSTLAGVAFIYVIAIILPTRSRRRAQTAIEGMATGFLLSGSMVHVISTNLVWLAKLPHMVVPAIAGATVVIVGCCMCLFVGRR